jgi:hypothetical protein
MELRVEIGGDLLICCQDCCSIGNFIVTFSPKEIEYFGEGLLGHEVEVAEQLKDPLEILATPLP